MSADGKKQNGQNGYVTEQKTPDAPAMGLGSSVVVELSSALSRNNGTSKGGDEKAASPQATYLQSVFERTSLAKQLRAVEAKSATNQAERARIDAIRQGNRLTRITGILPREVEMSLWDNTRKMGVLLCGCTSLISFWAISALIIIATPFRSPEEYVRDPNHSSILDGSKLIFFGNVTGCTVSGQVCNSRNIATSDPIKYETGTVQGYNIALLGAFTLAAFLLLGKFLLQCGRPLEDAVVAQTDAIRDLIENEAKQRQLQATIDSINAQLANALPPAPVFAPAPPVLGASAAAANTVVEVKTQDLPVITVPAQQPPVGANLLSPSTVQRPNFTLATVTSTPKPSISHVAATARSSALGGDAPAAHSRV